MIHDDLCEQASPLFRSGCFCEDRAVMATCNPEQPCRLCEARAWRQMTTVGTR